MKRATELILALSAFALSMAAVADTVEVTLRSQTFGQDERGRNVWLVQEDSAAIDLPRAAVIICDMWDKHWSRGATERVDEMAPRMNSLIASMRARGAHIIHCPSGTMEFYREHPARLRMKALPHVDMPAPRDMPDPPLPIDDSDEGSDTGETEVYKAWSRQHPAIEIDPERDGITEYGPEVYNYLAAHGIERVFIMGVHTNMCVLGRPFAIKPMTRRGVPMVLVRDMTDAMYNPARPPYVSREAGTQLVVEYIEKFWCPTVSSADLLD